MSRVLINHNKNKINNEAIVEDNNIFYKSSNGGSLLPIQLQKFIYKHTTNTILKENVNNDYKGGINKILFIDTTDNKVLITLPHNVKENDIVFIIDEKNNFKNNSVIITTEDKVYIDNVLNIELTNIDKPFILKYKKGNWKTIGNKQILDNKNILYDLDINKQYIATTTSKDYSEFILNSNRGLFFNGMDQTIPIDIPDLDFPFSFSGIGNVGQIFNMDMWLDNDGILNWIDLNNELHKDEKNISLLNTYMWFVIINENMVKVYSNKKLTHIITNGVKKKKTNNIGKTTNGHLGGFLSNIIYYNNEITLKQVINHYDNLERFLYINNGELTSDYLTIGELKDIIMYLPMCESIGFVIDLVKYKKIPIDNNMDYFIETGRNTAMEIVNENNEITCEITKPGTNRITPKITMYTDTMKVNDIISTNFTIEKISGSARIIKLVINDVLDVFLNHSSDITRSENYYFIREVKNELPYDNSIYLDSSKLGKCKISNIKFNKLLGVYRINNFTSTMRILSNYMEYSLRQIKWERDALGIPTGPNFNSYAVPYGSIGPLKININDSVLKDSFNIETIFKITKLNNDRIRLFMTSYDYKNNTGIKIELSNIDNLKIKLYLGNGNGYETIETDIPMYKYVHVIFKYVNNKVTVYLNGELIVNKDMSYLPSNVNVSDIKPISPGVSFRKFRISKNELVSPENAYLFSKNKKLLKNKGM